MRVAEALEKHPGLRGKTVVDGNIRGGASGGSAVKLGRARECVVLEIIEGNAAQKVYVNGFDIVGTESAVREQLREHHINFCGK